jgi:hypothetical protein
MTSGTLEYSPYIGDREVLQLLAVTDIKLTLLFL